MISVFICLFSYMFTSHRLCLFWFEEGLHSGVYGASSWQLARLVGAVGPYWGADAPLGRLLKSIGSNLKYIP